LFPSEQVLCQEPQQEHKHYETTNPSQFNSPYNGIKSKRILSSPKNHPGLFFSINIPITFPIFLYLTITHVSHLYCLPYACIMSYIYKIDSYVALSSYWKYKGLIMADEHRRNIYPNCLLFYNKSSFDKYIDFYLYI
jgi:hypothetical protein